MTVCHRFSALAAAVVLLGAVAWVASTSPLPVNKKVLLIAHRGDSGAAPENTLTAIRRAFKAGADAVEVDIRFTRDRQIVLMHDDTLDRTTNGSGTVAEFTLDEIRKLDAGTWKDPLYRGERVPTLREALGVARAAGRHLYLDVKGSRMGSEIRKVLDSLGIPPREIWVATTTEEGAADLYRHLGGARIIYWGQVPLDLSDAFFDRLSPHFQFDV
jgi:glycerophosphoryl diester phosphodiesterase